MEIDKDNVILLSKNHPNLCICNLVKILGCDLLYSALVVSHQPVKSDNTIYHKLSPTPIGMNLTLAEQLINYQDHVKFYCQFFVKMQRPALNKSQTYFNLNKSHTYFKTHSVSEF